MIYKRSIAPFIFWAGPYEDGECTCNRSAKPLQWRCRSDVTPPGSLPRQCLLCIETHPAGNCRKECVNCSATVSVAWKMDSRYAHFSDSVHTHREVHHVWSAHLGS